MVANAVATTVMPMTNSAETERDRVGAESR
jgi:hypothetical protein